MLCPCWWSYVLIQSPIVLGTSAVESTTCIVRLVIMPVTTCREICIPSSWGVYSSRYTELLAMRSCALARDIADSRSSGCLSSVSMPTCGDSPAVYNITYWSGSRLSTLLRLQRNWSVYSSIPPVCLVAERSSRFCASVGPKRFLIVAENVC